MKIAILTSGIMPAPAVQGGAVETLIDHYLEYNDKHKLHDITVFSIYHPAVKKQQALLSDVNHYQHIDTSSLIAKARKRIHSLVHKNTYYHNSIDFYFQQSLNIIKKRHFDCIIIENRPGFAPQLHETVSTKIVLHLHNDFLNNQTKEYKTIYDSATRIITVSDYINERVQTCCPHDEKTITVYNGIDLTPYSVVTSLSRESLGFQEDDFILAFSGRLILEKGILELIEAMNCLRDLPRIKLLVMGSSFYDNTSGENPFIMELKSKTQKLGNRIKFTGYIDHKMIPQYLKLSDVAVIPSTWEEPFGLTVVEGMAAGLPVITTNSGGIPEICDGVATIVNRDDIVNNLAAAILDLYEYPEKRAAMSEASLERSKLFDKETYAKNFFEALE